MDAPTMGWGLAAPPRHLTHQLQVNRSGSMGDFLCRLRPSCRGPSFDAACRKKISMSLSATRKLLFTMAVVLLSAMTANGAPQRGMPNQVVIPGDLRVAALSAEVLQRYAKEIAASGPQATILQAALLFDALGASGVHYSGSRGRDGDGLANSIASERPFRDPGETLESQTGNDEDLAVLYASALLGSGVRSVIIVSAGPLLLAFDTGIPSRFADRIFRSDEAYLKKGGTIWLPVDVTRVGGTLTEAWRSASRLPKRFLIETRRGRLPAANGADSGRDGLGLDKELLDRRFRTDLRFYASLTALPTPTSGNNRPKATVYLRLSALQTGIGLFDEAQASLDSAAAAGADRTTVLFRQAALFDHQERFREMAKVGGLLMTMEPGNPRGFLVAAYAALRLGDIDQAKVLYRKARKLSWSSSATDGSRR